MSRQIKVTLSEEEYAYLEHLSRELCTQKFNRKTGKYNPNIAATLRELILKFSLYENQGGLFNKKRYEELSNLLKELRPLNSNLNQISHNLNIKNIESNDQKKDLALSIRKEMYIEIMENIADLSTVARELMNHMIQFNFAMHERLKK